MNPTMEPLNNSAPLTNKEKMARLKRMKAERDERDRQYLERQQAEQQQQNDDGGNDPAAAGDEPPRRVRPQRVFPRNVPRACPRSPVRAPPSRLGRDGGAAPARTNSRDAKTELNALRNAYCKQQKQVADLSSTEDKMARLKRLQAERAEQDRRYAASRSRT